MANEYLKRTPTSTGNNKVFTWSGWVKRSLFSANYAGSQNLFRAYGGSGGDCGWRFDYTTPADSLRVFLNGAASGDVQADGKNRDCGVWMHVMCSFNSTLDQDSERVRIYVNGVRVPDNNTGYPVINYATSFNELVTQYIGTFNEISEFFQGEMADVFLVDGQALTPDVFGFYKDGNGYISAGSTQATDFRPGQWVPKTPRVIKAQIERNGGFGVNGFYLPMNDSSNFGADFHCEPNSIITLKGEDLPQPRNGAPTTTDAYVSQLRTDPYAANLVLAVPGISTSTSANLVTNGNFDSNVTGWTAINATIAWSSGRILVTRTGGSGPSAYQIVTTEIGKRYTLSGTIDSTGTGDRGDIRAYSDNASTMLASASGTDNQVVNVTTSFTATTTSTYIYFTIDSNGTAYFDNIVVREENVPLDYSAYIKGSGTNKTLTANGNAGVGYEIPSYYGSALTFDGFGDYLSQTYDADFNFGTSDFTVEMWVYPNTVNSTDGLFAVSGGGGGVPKMVFHLVPGTPSVHYNGLTGASNLYTGSGISIPAGQWSHLAYTRRGTTWNWYINGVSTGTGSNSTDITFTSQPYYIGYGAEGSFDSFDGKIQDFRIYKGVAKYSGGFDVPKPYTPVGIATWRAVPDTTANNFATLNPISKGSSSTLSGGNLIYESTGATSTTNSASSNFGMSSGKYYWEVCSTSSTQDNAAGIAKSAPTGNGFDPSIIDLYFGDGALFALGSSSAYGSAFSQFDICNIALDVDAGKIWFGKNGSYFASGNPTTGVNPSYSSGISGNTWFADCGHGGASGVTRSCSFNFGQNPTFSGNTTAGTYTDSNGKGLFKYEPPSGFLALCEDNLPTPAIKNPGEYFKTVLYTGDGNSGRSITGIGFTPDLVWIKERTSTSSHHLFDSVRGPGLNLLSDSTGVEGTSSTQLYSFDSDGFSGGSSGATNESGQNYVAWCWRAGAGTTSTNTDGSIQSVVSVNQDAGFSIVSYTGNETAGATIGHGLGKTPGFIIFKSRETALNWGTYHKSLGATQRVLLNSTAAAADDANAFNNTGPTSSIITLGASDAYNDDKKMIAYCWAEIEGFSKFGSYVGNGNADGPFIYTGGRPAFVMFKRTDTTGDWIIMDSSRESVNPNSKWLYPNGSFVEEDGSSRYVDFLSNGFKIRNSGTGTNASGGTYVYACFMESPFTTANSK